jgi:hypothetical protein
MQVQTTKNLSQKHLHQLCNDYVTSTHGFLYENNIVGYGLFCEISL